VWRKFPLGFYAGKNSGEPSSGRYMDNPRAILFVENAVNRFGAGEVLSAQLLTD
jgi:hypothetical protein